MELDPSKQIFRPLFICHYQVYHFVKATHNYSFINSSTVLTKPSHVVRTHVWLTDIFPPYPQNILIGEQWDIVLDYNWDCMFVIDTSKLNQMIVALNLTYISTKTNTKFFFIPSLIMIFLRTLYFVSPQKSSTDSTSQWTFLMNSCWNSLNFDIIHIILHSTGNHLWEWSIINMKFLLNFTSQRMLILLYEKL